MPPPGAPSAGVRRSDTIIIDGIRGARGSLFFSRSAAGAPSRSPAPRKAPTASAGRCCGTRRTTLFRQGAGIPFPLTSSVRPHHVDGESTILTMRGVVLEDRGDRHRFLPHPFLSQAQRYLLQRPRNYREAVTARCSTHSRNPRLALLSQTPSLPLAAMVSAILFMPKSSKVFLVGQPWSVSQPSSL